MRNPVVRLPDPAPGERGDPGGLDRRQVRRRWRTTSLGSGWTRPADWWTPEVDALAEAVLDDLSAAPRRSGVRSAAAGLGRARAEAGVGLPEALDDLCALYRVLPSGVPPVDVLRQLAEAWVEVGLASHRATTCEDPLSGLTSAAYLRTRLAEVYREAERSGQPLPQTHALVVVRGRAPVCGDDPEADASDQRWSQMLHRLTLGDALRTAFSGGETFAALGPGVSVGLVVRDAALPRMVRGLALQLHRYQVTRRSQVWVEGLPSGLPSAYQLLGDLER